MGTRYRSARRVLYSLALFAVTAGLIGAGRLWSLNPATAILASGGPRTHASPGGARDGDVDPAATAPDASRVTEALADMPLLFHENTGQYPEAVRFVARGNERAAFFTDRGLTLSLTGREVRTPQGKTDRWTVKLDFTNARPDVKVEPRLPSSTRFHRLKGAPEQWKTDARAYERLYWDDIWPGIDLAYSGRPDRMKHKLIVEPGADPTVPRFTYRGITGLSIRQGGPTPGSLVIETPVIQYDDRRPISCQMIDGKRVVVKSRYVILDSSPETGVFTYGVEVDDYDETLPLIIDPVTYISCGFIGGIDDDQALDVAVDDDQNFYIVGTTASDEMTFPVTVGPDLTYNGGKSDVFVAMLPPDGSALVFCTFLGGQATDRGEGIDVDDEGSMYVVGHTHSYDFPTLGGLDRRYKGYGDGFVTKIYPGGDHIRYSTFISGTGVDGVRDIVVDPLRNAYVVGFTDGLSYYPSNTLGTQFLRRAFVARINWSGSFFEYLTLISGNGDDDAWGVDIDDLGQAYVCGFTTSSQNSFPVTVGPDLTLSSGTDGFVASLDETGRNLRYCGYIGGYAFEGAKGIVVDDLRRAHVAGVTFSDEDFPTVVGPDLTYNGSGDAFVARVSAAGTGFEYSGYIGGDRYDEGNAISLSARKLPIVAGSTNSDESTFPVRQGPDLTHNGSRDGFVSGIWDDGSELVFSGFVGGALHDRLDGIAVDGVGDASLAGTTESDELTLPIVGGPDLTHNGAKDGLVAKLENTWPDEWTCREGRVGLAEDIVPDDVLFVNGSPGTGIERVVSVPLMTLIQIDMLAPPSGPPSAPFALYAYPSVEPTAGTVSVQPFGLGLFCFPTFLTTGLPKPTYIWNNLGHPSMLGIPTFPSTPAPSLVGRKLNGLNNPLTLTLQGFIRDDASTASGPVSVTNAVVMRVQ